MSGGMSGGRRKPGGLSETKGECGCRAFSAAAREVDKRMQEALSAFPPKNPLTVGRKTTCQRMGSGKADKGRSYPPVRLESAAIWPENNLSANGKRKSG